MSRGVMSSVLHLNRFLLLGIKGWRAGGQGYWRDAGKGARVVVAKLVRRDTLLNVL